MLGYKEVHVKILVTGGAGFIGSHVVDAYIEEGHEVVVVDNLSSGRIENLNPSARFYKADIRSAQMKEIFKLEKPDVLNHHAAQISVPASVQDPILDAKININGLLNVLESGRANNIQKVVFSSSGGAVYGEAEEYPTSEECPLRPLSPYAIAKAASENYLAFYGLQYGIDYVVLRYSNIYGPRQIPHGEAGVVALFMDSLLDGRLPAIYHFPDEPKGMTRDYCYVGDVVRANVIALEKGGGEALNIATGVATHTFALFGVVFDLAKKKVPNLALSKEPIMGPARPGDARRSCLKVEKAAERLGWRARVGLKDGIEKTLEWRIAAGK